MCRKDGREMADEWERENTKGESCVGYRSAIRFVGKGESLPCSRNFDRVDHIAMYWCTLISISTRQQVEMLEHPIRVEFAQHHSRSFRNCGPHHVDIYTLYAFDGDNEFAISRATNKILKKREKLEKTKKKKRISLDKNSSHVRVNLTRVFSNGSICSAFHSFHQHAKRSARFFLRVIYLRGLFLARSLSTPISHKSF